MSKFTELERLFTQGRITRREFMTRVSALGLATAVSPFLKTAKAQASMPKKGGRFRTALHGFSTTDTLDPATLNDIGNYAISWAGRNNLVEVDYKGNAIPELAESFEPANGAKTWIFHLRKGVEFHNGKSLDAKDVVTSINYHRNEESKSGAKGLVEQVTDVRADGKHTVIVELSGGNLDFPYVLSDYHFVVFPADTETTPNEWMKCMGTGAYMLKEFEPGVRAFAVRNPNYWKTGRGHFNELEILGISDVNSRMNALKTNQVDHISAVDLKTVHLLKKMQGIKVLRATGTYHNTMPMFTDVAPYNDNNVRLALKYAIDRQSIVDIFLQGYGIPGNDHPIAPIQKFWADLPQRQYNPDKARYHLKKAGLENHIFKLYTSQHAGFVDQANLFKETAEKAGLKIELVLMPADGYWSNVWLKKPFINCYWNGRMTVDWMFSAGYYGDAPWNDSHWRNERFDKLLVAARGEMDEAKRAEMYYECQKICRDEGGVIVHTFRDHVEAANNKMRFEKLAGNYEFDGAKAAEKWWFA